MNACRRWVISKIKYGIASEDDRTDEIHCPGGRSSHNGCIAAAVGGGECASSAMYASIDIVAVNDCVGKYATVVCGYCSTKNIVN